MTDFIQIRCQRDDCPYGKHNCCFGEIQSDTIGDNIVVERHKCEFAKTKEDRYVLVYIKKAA